MTVRTNSTTTELTLSGMKAQLSAKKKPLKVAKTKAAKPKVVAVSTDVKAKAAKPKAEKMSFNEFTEKVAKMFKITLAETTNKNGKVVKAGSNNKGITLSTVAGKNYLVLRDKSTVCEIHPNKAGYKLAIPNNRMEKVSLPAGTEKKVHPTWNDVFVAEPMELVKQLIA